MVYVAVDIGKRRCVTCVMGEDGSILDSGFYPNRFLDASRYAKQIVERYQGDCKAVVESTGNMCMKTYEAFESNGVEVKLANPVKTRAIAEARVKTDKVDSKILAHLLRADLIAECYVPTRDVRLSRALLSHRVNLTQEETRIKNRIRSLLDKYDLQSEYHDIFGAHGLQWLHTLQLNGHDNEILQSLLGQLEFLQGEEEKANGSIAKDASHNKYVPIIMSMTGFDYYSASVLAAYIADITRFPSPSHLVSWVGLCPSVYQTGESLYMGRMKGGSRKVKWIMTQAANSAIRSDPRMRAYYERKLRRHHHNVAVTHVANKMLRIIWHMLQENRLYNERKQRLYESKLKRMTHTAE
jgi:transposase